jgi:methylthioribulose-1-phosphate dehydratase
MLALETLAAEVAELARSCARRGSVPATSGNFSAVLSREPLRLLITPSGMDKGALSAEALLEVDAAGTVRRGRGRPSAEAPLHLGIVRERGAGAVAHTHSLWATLLSELHAADGVVAIKGFEMLKALDGVTSHEHCESLPIVDNAQDWHDGWRKAQQSLARHPCAHGLLIRGHGLYTWGRDVKEARRHLEALEYLLEAHGRLTWRS